MGPARSRSETIREANQPVSESTEHQRWPEQSGTLQLRMTAPGTPAHTSAMMSTKRNPIAAQPSGGTLSRGERQKKNERREDFAKSE
jgi:hypothetical protein